MKPLIEIRTLNLRRGTGGEFHRLLTRESLPIHKRLNLDVVAYGPSLQDENMYYVIRRFDSLDDREAQEDAFYGSDDWRQGPRQAMLALIEDTRDIVIEVDEGTLQGLRMKEDVYQDFECESSGLPPRDKK